MARRTRTVVAVAAAVAAFVALALPAGAADQRADTVTAFVAPGSKTDAKGGYYAFDAAPGSATTQSVVVRNDRSRPIVAHVEAVDAFTGASTGANYDPPGTAPSKTGTWIVVSTPEVTLQPGETRKVDFTVHVPADAKPGVYLAGISASVPPSATAGTTTATRKGASFQVTLDAQRLIAVQITVPGLAAPKLVVTGARATATPDGVALLVGIANRGNAFARGTGSIKVADTNLEHRFTINTFVPGTEIEYRVPWTKDVIPGNHALSVLLRYDGGRQTAWNGNVAINRTTQAQLESELQQTRLPSDGGLPVPLLAGAIVAVVACLGGAVVLRRRRRPAVAGATATVN